MELTLDQSNAVRQEPDRPHQVVDPVTKRNYVILSSEAFAKLQDDAADVRHSRGWLKATQRGMALALGEEP